MSASMPAEESKPPARRRLMIGGVVAAIVLVAAGWFILERLTPGARRLARLEAAMLNLKSIGVAQWKFRNEDRDGDGILEHAQSLDELVEAGLLSPEFRSGVKDGYRLRLFAVTMDDWSTTAEPLEFVREPYPQFLYMDSSLVLKRERDRSATKDSPSQSF